MDRFVFHSKTDDFVRRTESENGQIESICLRCFATVARSDSIKRVEYREEQHLCPEKNRAPFKAHSA
jgi:hypothetical protein